MNWIAQKIKTGSIHPVLLVYGFYSYCSILDLSLLNISFFMSLVRWGTIVFLVYELFVQFFLERISLKGHIVSFLVLVFFFIASSVTHRAYLMVYALLLLASIEIDVEDILRTSLFASVMAVLSLLILCRIGIITDYIYTAGSNEVLREAHCYGFTYYSRMPYTVFYCIMIYVCLRKEKLKLLEYILILALNYYLYVRTTLRLTFYLTIFVMVFVFFLSRVKTIHLNRKPVLFFSSIAFPVGTVLTYYLMRLYSTSGSVLDVSDGSLSSRLLLMAEGYKRYGIRLLGSYIRMEGNSVLKEAEHYFYIDSGFAYSLLGYGLIFTIVVVFLYTVMFRYSCITENKYLFVWITAVLIFTMINNSWVSLNYNPILFFAIPALERLNVYQKNKNIQYKVCKQEGF